MHRIDTPTAMIDKFGQGKNGFTNGDTTSGRRATQLTDSYWDAIQEEVCAAIESVGIVLDKTQHNQLSLAIQKAITDKGYLSKANNLSDIGNASTALSNLSGVPTSRKINGKTLTGDITLNASDIGALTPSQGDDRYVNISGDTMTGNLKTPYLTTGGITSTDGYVTINAVYYNGNQYARLLAYAADGTTQLGYMEFDYNKNCNFAVNGRAFSMDNQGNFHSPGGIYESTNVRVYSPNNPPPATTSAGLNSSGWWKDQSTGLIMQWGSFISGSSNVETHNFPIAFPNAGVSVTANIGVSGTGTPTVYVEQNNNLSFKSRTSTSSLGVYWFAMGF